MKSFSTLEWNAVLNRAESSLREQERLLDGGDGPSPQGVRGTEPRRAEVPADWDSSRRRFRGAHSRLAQLAEQGHPAQRTHMRDVVERLARNAEDLGGRLREEGEEAPQGTV
ncbi:hypothetical protein [Thiohalorhabdus methylotrophus]|uniref:Uncharacterized protein n=1 Tax=Thiohalorhabdus methylotrophus TaxID=3242694 RepID=A0ABV4TRL8_9GAMM